MIIIVEDDELSGRLLIKMLQEYFSNKEFSWFKSIKEAVTYFSNYKSTVSDVLILDLYLEDGEAWDLLDRFRIKTLQFKGRIVLVPGIKPNEKESRIVEFYKPYKVLVKPVSLQDLKHIII
jgi:response regulator of citrate/malate metabolism